MVFWGVIRLISCNKKKKEKKSSSREHRAIGSIQSKVKSTGFVSCWFMCDYTAECCTVAIRGPEPPFGARGLLQTATSYERVSTFCNRKCDHRVHPATDAKQKKKNALGLKCHVNSWVQPLNTSGVLSTPFNAFKGQGFAQTGLCSYSP